MNSLLLGIFLLLTSLTASAFVTQDSDNQISRFQPYGNNFMMYPQATKYRNGRDDVSLEGRYSFKYIIFDCQFYNGSSEEDKCTSKSQLFLSYTGEFDFYVDFFDKGRESGPVINRTSNPALHWLRKYDFEIMDNIKLITSDLSIQHRSDGQAVEVYERDSNGQLLTQIEYNNDPYSEYFDAISRGSDYLQLATGFVIGDERNKMSSCKKTYGCYEIDISAKAYLTHDDEINWGPLAGTDTKIHDYDILRIKYTNSYDVSGKKCWNDGGCSILEWMLPGKIDNVTWQVEYTAGHKGAETDSLDINFIFPFSLGSDSFKLPWFIGMHFGPMDRLSNYTESTSSIGVGLMFSY